jgi:tRNA A-37 threonylcarbamoyl transferase component Bud32
MQTPVEIGASILNTYKVTKTLEQDSVYQWVEAIDTAKEEETLVVLQVLLAKVSPAEVAALKDYFDNLIDTRKKKLRLPVLVRSDDNHQLIFVYSAWEVEPLANALRREPSQTGKWWHQASETLHAIHKQNLIHGRVTLDNFVVLDEEVHLTGFGYAPLLVSGKREVLQELAPLLAPEVTAQGSLTTATDIYAFAKTVTDTYPELAATQWYQKATAATPDKRFRQMRHMCHELLETLNNLAITSSNGHFAYDSENFSNGNSATAYKPVKLTAESLLAEGETDTVADTSGYDSQITDDSRQSLKQRTVKFSSLFALLLGIFLMPFSIPHFEPVCKILGNCVEDNKYQQKYDQGMRQVNEARSLAASPKDLGELQKARNTLNSGIKQLTAIPTDAQVYPELRKTLPEYWDELSQMENRLERYTQAQQQLDKAHNLVTNAREKTKAAKSIPQLEEAQAVWQKGKKMLNETAPNLMVPDPAKQLAYESQNQISRIEQRIDNIMAEIQRQKEEELARARQAELERQQQAELARQREAERIGQAQAAQAARERERQAQAAQAARERQRQAQAAQAARERQRQRRQYSQTSNRNFNSSGDSSDSGQNYRRRRSYNYNSSGDSSGQSYRRRRNNYDSSGDSSGQSYRRRRNNYDSSGDSSGQSYRRRRNNYDSSNSNSDSGQNYRRRRSYNYNYNNNSDSGQNYRRRRSYNYNYNNNSNYSSGGYRRYYRRQSNDGE